MEKKKLTCCDIMVGDYVYSTFSDKPCKVQAIELSEHGYGSVRVTGVDGVKDIVSLSPIPLTSEILERNGIKWLMSEPSGNRTYRCNEPPISCTFIPDRGWYMSAGPVGSSKLPFAVFSMAYYVHELQHALRFCGINDKEIVP